MSEDGDRRAITFQCGLVRESYGFEGKDLTALNHLACSFLEQKFPDHGHVCISEKIILFRHEYTATNILERLTNIDKLTNGSIVEIVISAKSPQDEMVIRPHALFVHSYRSPAFCDFCGQMLFGLVRQGLKCDGCGGNFHKRCAYKIPNNCSDSKTTKALTSGLNNTLQFSTLPRQNSEIRWEESLATLSNASTLSECSSNFRDRRATWSGRPVWIDRAIAGRIQVPHTFAIHSYKRPTVCQICKRLLRGLFRQGVQCKDCKFNCHRRCASKAPKNCPGDVSALETGSTISTDSGTLSENFSEMEIAQEMREESDEGSSEGSQHRNSLEEAELPSPTSSDGELPNLSPTSSSNIPLQRVIQSVKHTKRKASKVLKQGWVIHFTNKDMQRRRHYWRLDTKCLTLYQDPNTKNFYKEIPLSEILSVDTNIDPLATDAFRDSHCFEMKTRTLLYYVGQSDPAEDEVLPDADSGIGTNLGLTWADTIRSALMPGCVTPTTSLGPGRTMSGAASEEEMEITLDDLKPREPQPDISQLYQVFPDDILGSGQFGIVYGGVHRESGREVAIKVIDKLRFPTKQEAQLKNEYAILKHLNHQGIVNLEQMFETPEKVFVVMEKMRGDMLEMILSSPLGRLDERCTKFLITQVLIALRYLHSKNVVHCDLKPENVLLSCYNLASNLPQVKLCDFGFARIIEDKSFRRSVVGTPAYLAPEVLLNKGYNRSLDMWSVGVVIYVSLSGTFPFNEDEEIQDQIHNAAFMYPPDPWSEISSDAVNLIANLLQVQHGKRYTCDKSLIHPWLQDYQTWVDCRNLETVVGERYLTHESDDVRWELYGKRLKEEQNQRKEEETNKSNVNKFFHPPGHSNLKTSISFL